MCRALRPFCQQFKRRLQLFTRLLRQVIDGLRPGRVEAEGRHAQQPNLGAGPLVLVDGGERETPDIEDLTPGGGITVRQHEGL